MNDAGRQDYDPQPPDDVEPCEVTERRQAPVPSAGPGSMILGPWTTYNCIRAKGGHDNHYHPDIGWWQEETDDRPF